MSSKFRPLAGEVRALRDEKGIGMQEAKRQLRREALIREVDDIQARRDPIEDRFDALLDVVAELVREPL